MAKLSAHGKEIGRIDYLCYRLAFFDDGNILKNTGSGWRLYKKVKTGYKPEDVCKAHKENHGRKIQRKLERLVRLYHSGEDPACECGHCDSESEANDETEK